MASDDSVAKPVFAPPRSPKALGNSVALAPGSQSFAALLLKNEILPNEFTPLIVPQMGKLDRINQPYPIFDIVQVNIATGQIRVIGEGLADWGSTLSWSPHGDQLAFDGLDGWIHVIELKTGTIRKTVEGSVPAWAPEGNQLAFRIGNDIWLRDMKTGNTSRILNNYFWNSLSKGPMYWSLDGKILAYAVYRGFLGYEERCHVLDVQSGDITSVQTNSFSCGPWISTSR